MLTIALVDSVRIIGHLRDGVISPAFEFQCGQGLRGTEWRREWAVVPLFASHAIDKITLPPSTVTISLEQFSKEEQRFIAQAFERCEQLVRDLKAAESGITLAPANWKPPKL